MLLLMDTESTKDANGCCVNKPVAVAVVVSLDGGKVEDHANGDNDSHSNSLLALPRGGLSRKSENKTYRRVQWNDALGNKLVEVLEYEAR